MLSAVVTACGCYSGGAGELKNFPGVPKNEKKQQNEQMNVAVYYIKQQDTTFYLVREMHPVPYDENGPKAALNELISGRPVTRGAAGILPPDTRVLGLTIREGLATVNFSADVLNAGVGSTGEVLGIQSIVNTLTEFPEIREVAFQVEGRIDDRTRDWWGHVGLYNQPFRRYMDNVYEPAVWVTHPVSGQIAGAPLLVKGNARVFEGEIRAQLYDAEGKIIAEDSTPAPLGTSGRGDFEMKLNYTPPGKGNGRLEVFRIIPEDGSPLDKIEISIQWP